MNSNTEYNSLREEELLWLINKSELDMYKTCKSLDEAENVYRQMFPAFYEGSVRRWLGWHEGVHLFG